MRSAAHILDEWIPEMSSTLNDSQYHNIKNAINEARKEAIEACSESAKTIKTGNSGSWYDADVDKQSILNLLNQIK